MKVSDPPPPRKLLSENQMTAMGGGMKENLRSYPLSLFRVHVRVRVRVRVRVWVRVRVRDHYSMGKIRG